jgi:ABC-2 type transport system ATP-binding protein
LEKNCVIDVSSVSKSFRKVRALDRLSISVRPGEAFSLLGPNGAGKTTLMKILLGLVNCDGGSVLMQQYPVTSPLSRSGVRYLPENITFPSWATPRILFRQMERVRREASLRDFNDRCGELECGELVNRPVGKMSRGQRQRIALSLITCGNPRMVLLDEPSSGLDPGGRILVRNLIRKLSSRGTTILVNSHLLGEVERVCDTAAFINRGRLVASGELDKLSRLTGIAAVDTHDPSGMKESLEAAGYSCRTESGGVAVHLLETDDFRRMVGTVLETGIEFSGILRKRESLEDVFLRLMDGDAMKGDSDVS